MTTTIRIDREMDPEMRERLRRLDRSLAKIREEIEMTISPQIQKAIDGIRQTRDLVKAVADADKVQTEQISTLTAKVTELQTKLDEGGEISADDLAGIAEITSDIDMVNTQLKSAIPANTEAGTGNASSGGTSGSSETGSTSEAGSSSETGTTEGQTGEAQTAEQQNMGNPATGLNVEPGLNTDTGGAKPLPGTGG